MKSPLNVINYSISYFINIVNDTINTLDEIETKCYNDIEVMTMNEQWKNIIITDISLAIYVPPNSGKHIHNNRPYHGLVLNDASSVKDYIFDDGRILHTVPNTLFYLPKGSSYHVESHQIGGCYAINFDSEIHDNPFSVSFRNTEALLHNFKAACDAWKSKSEYARLLSMRALYDGIYKMQKEQKRQYISKTQVSLIAPAVEEIERVFTQNDLTVCELAAMCGISEVYFRRLFLNTFGISPKEYIIQKRIEYAKTLLSSKDFSVGEVGILCGYAEPCHFSREFSKRVGISPMQYDNL